MPTDSGGVVCRDVSKTYATATGVINALAGIDAEFAPRKITAVMGPSGSGKSSLLRVVAGLDRPDKGTVVVEGVDLRRLEGGRLRRIRHELIGYVFQRPEENFIPYLTLEQNLAVVGREAPHRRDPHVLDKLALGHRLSHLPGQLSGGEQQRAALAQALVTAPSFVVADEPTAELDAESGHLLLDAISAAAREGVGFIIATHDPEVAGIADEVVLIDSGKIAREWGPLEPARGPATSSGTSNTSTDKAPMVMQMTGVSKTYPTATHDIRAVDGVTLEVRERELVAVMGRSGSGKTTLLNLLAGWERPDAGSIAGPLAVQRPRWADIAVVPQTLGLIEELSILDNITFALRLGNKEPRDDDHLIEDLGLDKLVDRFPTEVSLGEQQRCALARALVVAPRLVLADEPTAHQDAQSATRVFRALRDAVDRGGSVVVATHDERVLDYADRTIEMADGQIARDD